MKAVGRASGVTPPAGGSRQGITALQSLLTATRRARSWGASRGDEGRVVRPTPMTPGIMVLLCSALISGCADGPATSAPTAAATYSSSAVALHIEVRPRPGSVKRASLRCTAMRVRARGFLTADPRRLCRRARRVAGFLARPARRGGVCTEVFGGPETAWIRGTIGNRRIDRRFSQADGCEIADWNRVAELLGERA